MRGRGRLSAFGRGRGVTRSPDSYAFPERGVEREAPVPQQNSHVGKAKKSVRFAVDLTQSANVNAIQGAIPMKVLKGSSYCQTSKESPDSEDEWADASRPGGEPEDDPYFKLARRVAPTKEIIKYRIIRMVNPFEFYMIEESEVRQSFHFSGGLDRLQNVMNQIRVLPKPERYYENKMYIVFDKTSQRWVRCRLVSYDLKTGTGSIFLFDYYPRLEQVLLQNLKDIPLEVALEPIIPVYRCHLYDIVMPSNVSESPKTWPFMDNEKDNKKFRDHYNRTKPYIWVGLQMTWAEKRVGKSEQSDLLVDLGMVIFQDTEHVWEGRSLNSWLVAEGYAEKVGVGATYSKDFFLQDMEPMFSLVQAPQIRLPPSFSQHIPFEAGARLSQVLIKRIRGMDCIYILLLNKYKDLKAMEAFMERHLEQDKVKHLELKAFKVGMAVIFKRERQDEYGLPISPYYHRAVVIGVLVGDGLKTKVLLVDSGFVVDAFHSDLYSMPKRLQEIPSFVHRIHLCTFRPCSIACADKKNRYIWPEGHSKKFANYMKERKNKWGDPAFFALRPTPRETHDVVYLDEVHQRLQYRCIDKHWDWHAGPITRNGDKFDKLPLVKSFYCSFGVELMFLRNNGQGGDGEGVAIGKEFWRFESLTSQMVESAAFPEQVQLTPSKVYNKKNYYDTVRAGYKV